MILAALIRRGHAPGVRRGPRSPECGCVQVIGAVNVFGTPEGYLSESEIAVGQALADVATVGLLQERSLRQARVLSEQLRAALTSRIVIEQAKGVLAERHALEMDQAFEMLRSHARRTNGRLSEVAQALLDGSLPSDALG